MDLINYNCIDKTQMSSETSIESESLPFNKITCLNKGSIKSKMSDVIYILKKYSKTDGKYFLNKG